MGVLANTTTRSGTGDCPLICPAAFLSGLLVLNALRGGGAALRVSDPQACGLGKGEKGKRGMDAILLALML